MNAFDKLKETAQDIWAANKAAVIAFAVGVFLGAVVF
jgi:hypothetical protein